MFVCAGVCLRERGDVWMVTWAVLERGEERRGGEGEYLGSFYVYGWDGKGRGEGLGYGIWDIGIGLGGGMRWIGLDWIG